MSPKSGPSRAERDGAGSAMAAARADRPAAAGAHHGTRGELRAARDCRGAIADFERVLEGTPPPGLAELAVRGRAVCLLRLADPEAPAALRAYLDRFPEGPFAAEARRRLHPQP